MKDHLLSVCACLSAVTVFLIFCVILVFTWKHIQIWCGSLYVQRRLLAVCVSVTRAGCGGYLVRLLIQTTVHHFHSQRRSVLVCDITGQVAPSAGGLIFSQTSQQQHPSSSNNITAVWNIHHFLEREHWGHWYGYFSHLATNIETETDLAVVAKCSDKYPGNEVLTCFCVY